MKRFCRFYYQLCIANIGRILAYRMDFVSNVIGSIAWGVFSILAMLLLTSNTAVIAGWTRSGILLLTITYSCIVGIFHICFSRNFVTAARIIHYGEFDSLALKPLHPLILLTMSEINISASIRLLLSFGVLFYLNGAYDLGFTLGRFLFFCLYALIGVAVLYWIHVFLISILFWRSYLSNLIDLGSLFTSAARYPIDILRFAPPGIMAFFFVSLMTVNIPTKVLLGTATIFEIVSFLVISVVICAGSFMFWTISRRAYSGASS